MYARSISIMLCFIIAIDIASFLNIIVSRIVSITFSKKI